MFASAQLMRKLCEQHPSKKSDLDVIVVGLHFKWYTLSISGVDFVKEMFAHFPGFKFLYKYYL
jgi:hypothetical protein